MKKILSAFLLLGILAASLAAAPAEARIYGNVWIGGGGYYPGYYYPGYAYGPYPGYYVAPPPVVYAPPPPAVVYAQPAYAAPPPAPAPVAVDQSSPTFTDDMGRTCREYQSKAVVDGHTQSTYGTACLQPDGTWRITN